MNSRVSKADLPLQPWIPLGPPGPPPPLPPVIHCFPSGGKCSFNYPPHILLIYSILEY